jgi:hypothetical protein
MSANKNMRVCVATSPGLLIEVDANRTGQKPTGLLNRAARTSYVRRCPGAGSGSRIQVPATSPISAPGAMLSGEPDPGKVFDASPEPIAHGSLRHPESALCTVVTQLPTD